MSISPNCLSFCRRHGPRPGKHVYPLFDYRRYMSAMFAKKKAPHHPLKPPNAASSANFRQEPNSAASGHAAVPLISCNVCF
jgi:hypothetical protein